MNERGFIKKFFKCNLSMHLIIDHKRMCKYSSFLFAIETVFTYSNKLISTILFIYKILLNNLDNNKHKRYFSSLLPFKPTRATVSLKIFLSLCGQRRFNFPQRLIFHNTCCLCFVHLKRRYNFWIKNNSFKSLSFQTN